MELTPRRLRTIEAIHRHWWLPSHYLYEFTKDLCKDVLGQRRDLALMVKEGLLERPRAINNPLVKNDFLNYALTPKSLAILEQMGKRNVYSQPPSGGYEHASMTVAITANIDLECSRAGYRFITQEEILANAPQKSLPLPSSISYTFNGKVQQSDAPTVPDAIFGIDYGTGCRFFAVEADRGTETVAPTKSFKNSSILRKLLAYNYILQRGEYKNLLNIPVLYPLLITTAPERAANMKALAERQFKSSKLMLFGDIPGFTYFFRSPPLLPRLFTQPWKRAGYPDFLINQP